MCLFAVSGKYGRTADVEVLGILVMKQWCDRHRDRNRDRKRREALGPRGSDSTSPHPNEL
jgi:hypothetical protein